MITILENAEWNLNKLQLEYREKFIKWCNEGNKLNYITQCPFCKGKNFDILSNVDRFGLSFNVIKCNKCDLIMTNPYIKEKFLPEYYNKFYHPLIYGVLEPKKFLFDEFQGHKIFRKVKKFLNNKQEIKVFEIGAGKGSNLKSFKRLADKNGFKCKLIGLEYNEDYVKKAKEDDILLYSESLKDFSKKFDFKFDVIILSHVFEHVIDFNDFLKDVKKLMNEDSVLYIEVPGILKLHKNISYKLSFKRYLVHAHIYHFTAKTLSQILISNDYKIKSINENIEAIVTLKGNNINIPNSDVIKYLSGLNKLKFLFLIEFYFEKLKKKIKKLVK